MFDFAKQINPNLFNTLDHMYDKDGTKTSISEKRHLVENNTFLFQDENKEIKGLKYNNGRFEIIDDTKKSLGELLDELDDGIANSSFSNVDLSTSNVKLGKDKIEYVDSVKLLDSEVSTIDNANKTLSISSADVHSLLKGIGEKLGEDRLDYALNLLKNEDNKKEAKELVADFIKGNFGGSLDSVLANLLDKNVEETVSGYLQEKREEAFNQIVEKTLEKVLSSFVDKAGKMSADGETEFNLEDTVKAAQIDYTEIAKNTLSVEEIDVYSDEFINYLNNINGDADEDVSLNDEISIDSLGNVTVSGYRNADNIKTLDGAKGNFSISSADVKKILDVIENTRIQPELAVKNYLKSNFGEEVDTAISKIADVELSKVAKGYLAPIREKALD